MTWKQLNALTEIHVETAGKIIAIEKTSITEPLVIKYYDDGGNLHCVGITADGKQVTYQV